MIDLDKILNKVKDSEDTKLKQETASQESDPRLLSLKRGNKYTLRLLPNHHNTDDTFISYKDVGFTSRVEGGAFIYAGRSLSDADPKQSKNDLIRKVQWDTYEKAKNAGDEQGKKDSYKLIPNRKQLVNAYLVAVEGDDENSKKKIGQDIVFRYPAGIDNKTGEPKSDILKVIHAGIFGEMAKKIGKRAFDLTDKGRSLIVKVIEKGGFNNYGETRFDDAEDLNLSAEQIKKIYESTHNLQELVPPVKPNDEVQKLLDEHWWGTSASAKDEVDDEDDQIPMGNTKGGDDDLDDLLD